jgi:hypothetical protein
MAARIGNVLYWIGCIAALLLVAVGAILWGTDGHTKLENIGMLLFPGIIALIAWGIGKACRYILTDN